ncbi:YkgJ family cysteine cluster protein [Sulfurimonas sp. MAG313]|nr:YkgJ family cysteine cluster protein [Sulfurimonas sp. MAG313]MDF1881162.1 YkgJ family cysteine cluster protein [Sulfurimonas sp. MAG313]
MMNEQGYNYSFNPNACDSCGGNCCTGESGNIFVSLEEIQAISKHLKLSIDEFKKSYLTKVGYKFSLKEKMFEESHDCTFFDRKIQGCGIYLVRPIQCRTFPFWPYFKSHEDELEKECPGIIFNESKEKNV